MATPIMLEAVMRVRASRGKILNVFCLSITDNFKLQAFVWRLSTVTSSFGQQTFWQCPLCPRTNLTLLKSRLRKLSLRLLQFSKPPCYIRHVTVCFYLLVKRIVFMSKIGDRRIRVITLQETIVKVNYRSPLNPLNFQTSRWVIMRQNSLLGSWVCPFTRFIVGRHLQ